MSDTFGEFIPILRTLDVVRQDSGQRDCLYSFNQTSEFDDGSPLWGRSRGAVGKRHRRPVAVALEVLLEAAVQRLRIHWPDSRVGKIASRRQRSRVASYDGASAITTRRMESPLAQRCKANDAVGKIHGSHDGAGREKCKRRDEKIGNNSCIC